MPNESLKTYPSFFEILSDSDKGKYIKLHEKVGSPENRYNRNKRLQTFNDILYEIKNYCIQNDGDEWKRYLVCGICWIDNDIVINTRQLRILIEKSKSTINGSFAKMGYYTVPMKENDTKYILQKIPCLKSHPQELRQWTTRKNVDTPNSQSDDDSFLDLKLNANNSFLDLKLNANNSNEKNATEDDDCNNDEKTDMEIDNYQFSDFMISDLPCFTNNNISFDQLKINNFEDFENNYFNFNEFNLDNNIMMSNKCL